jgi:hypothetical protein
MKFSAPAAPSADIAQQGLISALVRASFATTAVLNRAAQRGVRID